jgi:hypothetical protein
MEFMQWVKSDGIATALVAAAVVWLLRPLCRVLVEEQRIKAEFTQRALRHTIDMAEGDGNGNKSLRAEIRVAADEARAARREVAAATREARAAREQAEALALTACVPGSEGCREQIRAALADMEPKANAS